MGKEESKKEDNKQNTKESMGSLILKNDIVKGVLTNATWALLVVIFGAFQGFWALPKQMLEMQQSVSQISGQVGMLAEDVDSLADKTNEIELELASANIEKSFENLQEDIDGVNHRVDTLEQNILFYYVRLKPDNDMVAGLSVQMGSAEAVHCLSAPSWSSQDVIATNTLNNKEYKAADLANAKLLIPYELDGKEFVFYGQFNENNQWDNECVVNVYQDDVLILVTEGLYDNGELVKYKQILPDVTKNNESTWVISERQPIDNVNVGVSMSYIRNQEIRKEFTLKNVLAEDVITVDDFESNLDTRLESYYCGNTANGYYNDTTGNAYMIKFAEDGTVRTLYCGNFENGNFHDYTGNAWYIVKNENTNYMYYKGVFDTSVARNDPECDYFEGELSQERINEIIQNFELKDNLRWHSAAIQNM